MKKTILGLMAVVLMCTVITACDDDEKVTTPPTFKGFKYTPNPAHQGDTITVTADYDNRGEYWNTPRCSWSLVIDTVDAQTGYTVHDTLTQSIKQSVADESLQTRFIIPKTTIPGKYTCSLTVSFNNSMNTTNIGAQFVSTTAEGYTGRFNNTQVLSGLYSRAEGYFSLQIEKAQ